MTKMDIVEFAEKYLGIELKEYQKRILEMFTPECTDRCVLVWRSNSKRTWLEMEHHH